MRIWIFFWNDLERKISCLYYYYYCTGDENLSTHVTIVEKLCFDQRYFLTQILFLMSHGDNAMEIFRKYLEIYLENLISIQFTVNKSREIGELRWNTRMSSADEIMERWKFVYLFVSSLKIRENDFWSP